VTFVLQPPLRTLSQIRCHDAGLEAIERRAEVGSMRYDGDVLIPRYPALHDHVLAVDSADAVAVQLCVILVYDRVGLACVDRARKIPEAGAVEVDVAGADHTLVNAYSTLWIHVSFSMLKRCAQALRRRESVVGKHIRTAASLAPHQLKSGSPGRSEFVHGAGLITVFPAFTCQ
jgi:hypothetical protein